MEILNGLIYLDSFQFQKAHLVIEGEYFSTITTNLPISHSDKVLDASNCYVIPGLIDIHLHGACGYDFCDATPDAISQIAQYELQNGITTIFPTTMTLAKKEICHILSTLAHYHNASTTLGRSIRGIHLEGPYISSLHCGAQDARFCLQPKLQEFKQFQKSAQGLIRYLTLAPEQWGALDFIETLSHEVIISLGHTSANYDIAMEAFHRGASHVTHCYNAMPPLHHRKPGIIGAAMDYEKAYIELICDGIHLHPATIRQSFKLFDDDYIIFISDSTMATGLPDGQYTLGCSPIQVLYGEARTPQGNLAGSTTHLMDCLRKAISFGIPFERALKCVTANPARETGLYQELGSITPGKKADCVILNQALEIIHVIKDGQLIF